jgi:hypothetical protein
VITVHFLNTPEAFIPTVGQTEKFLKKITDILELHIKPSMTFRHQEVLEFISGFSYTARSSLELEQNHTLVQITGCEKYDVLTLTKLAIAIREFLDNFDVGFGATMVCGHHLWLTKLPFYVQYSGPAQVIFDSLVDGQWHELLIQHMEVAALTNDLFSVVLTPEEFQRIDELAEDRCNLRNAFPQVSDQLIGRMRICAPNEGVFGEQHNHPTLAILRLGRCP